MAKRKIKPGKTTKPATATEKVEPLDVDGLSIAAERLANISRAAFDDVLELAYAYLFIHDPDRAKLASLGLVSPGAGARAARMLADMARREAEGDEDALRSVQ